MFVHRRWFEPMAQPASMETWKKTKKKTAPFAFCPMFMSFN